MRITAIVTLVIGLLVSLPVGAHSQVRPVQVSIGGGWTAPNSEVRDHLGDGFNFNFGVQANVTPVIGIEGLYSFNGLGEKQLTFNIFDRPNAPGTGTPTDFSADMNMQYGTASLIIQKPDGGVRPYGLVGMGIFYRPVKVTSPGVGWMPGYCDPSWYYCSPGGWVEVTNIHGERSSTDFGMSFGGGANFKSFYAELRYHYIWGPTVEEQTVTIPVTGVSQTFPGRSANGQFLQTTFGFRF